LAQEREVDLRKTLKGDYDQRSYKESAKWEVALKQLEEEKDVLVAKLEDHNKLKSQGERMREKVEELDAITKQLKDQLAVVEESNSKRLERIFELEGLDKDRDFNKKKIDQYKSTVKDLELKLTRLSSEARIRESEHATMLEELTALHAKNRHLESELLSTKRELQEKTDVVSERAATNSCLGATSDFAHPEMSEKLARLERENDYLRMQSIEPRVDESQAEAVQVKLETLRSQYSDLDSDAQKLRREISKLQLDRSEKLSLLERSESRLRDTLVELAASQSKSQEAFLVTGKLNDAIKKKESENLRLASDKDKLETYTKKALHNVQEKYLLAIRTCKDQLMEKDERIQKLTDQYKQYRSQSQRESQLMSSAIYELGMHLSEKGFVRNLDRPRAVSNAQETHIEPPGSGNKTAQQPGPSPS
jgi:chromosome segregation ATPase